MDEIVVYVTAPDMETARTIGRDIVSGRLAACVNILPGMESFYWWDEAVQQDDEVVLIAKTTALHFEALKDRITALHPYELPCVVGLPITCGHAPFLRWIHAQTGTLQEPCEIC